MTRNMLFMPSLASGSDLALLIARLATGIFLVGGVWDNITSSERMAEFVGFMGATSFPAPDILAPFSVYTQFAFGIMLILGLLTRWAGIGTTITFIVALVMVHWSQTLREWWPALALVALGVIFATQGAGKLSLDRWLDRKI